MLPFLSRQWLIYVEISLNSQGQDDMRVDAVMQQVFTIMNKLLSENKKASKRKLLIRTYKVSVLIYCFFVVFFFNLFMRIMKVWIIMFLICFIGCTFVTKKWSSRMVYQYNILGRIFMYPTSVDRCTSSVPSRWYGHW